jgi:seryl-tRNA synthetase
LQSLETNLDTLLLTIPNLLHESVPPGQDERDNPVVRTWGQPADPDFEPQAHWDLGRELGIIDFDRGARLAGSRFYVLLKAGAALQRALIQWFLDVHTREHGYVEVYPPFVVREAVMVAAGQLPKFRDNLYRDAEDDLWLVPTGEVPLTGLHAGEILGGGSLPLSYVAYTACFRREKMSAGRDVRGIKRGHQFDKVEMYKLTRPEDSYDELERMLTHAEDLLRRLEIPYRVLQLCAGELAFQSALSYDIEVWAPGVQEWLEVSSLSNVTDFQARRADIRFRREPGTKPEFVHTLNGSGLALPRMMIALLENFQQADGSVIVPKPLRPYVGADRIERPDQGRQS